MSDLRVSLVQTSLYWKSPEANRAMLEERLSDLNGATDLVILPEMFTTGFTMDAGDVAEPPRLHTERWMKQMAKRLNSVITGSYVVSDGGRYFNRLLWVYPDGGIEKYDKRHLFRMADEDQHYAPGNSKLITDIKGWKVAPFICYDLRFPVWIRNSFNSGKFGYDLALFVANWPAPRARAWEILLKARAIENSAFVAGVNRTGTDGAGVTYKGGSLVSDPRGELLADLSDSEEVITVTLHQQALEDYRDKFPVQLDSDNFTIL